jgi:alkanesulfonate monooxygenase SsuD/methylene tetrahydromethanopterin reductase-like flavin-dependent oxidoreductase (luciferase family)
MKFGAFYLLEKPVGLSDREVYENALEQCRWADELGFDAVWLAEHRFTEYGIMPDPFVFGAAVARTTRRVRIGTAVTVVPFYHPIRLAEQVAMLDVMSDGRFDFGVGRGYQAGEYAGFGIPMDESRARFEEVLDITLGLLAAEGPFSYAGRFFAVRDVSILPKPLQRPHPPVWMAVMRSPESFETLVRRDFRLLSGNPYRMDPEYREAFARYKEALAQHGHAGRLSEAVALIPTWIAEDNDQAVAEPRASAESYMAAFRRYGSPAAGGRQLSRDYAHYADWDQFFSTVTYEREVRANYLIGDPAHVVEKVRALQVLGIEYICCWFNRGGLLPQRRVRAAMELFAREVMPRFRGTGISTAEARAGGDG